MRLNPNFIKHTVDGVTLVVPTAEAGFHGLVQGNKTVGVIVDCLENDTTQDAIVDTICERFEGNRADIEADVANVIGRLKEIGAIDGE